MTGQEPILVNRRVPAGLQMNLAAHRSEANRTRRGGRRNQLGNGLPVTRDSHILTFFDGPKKFRKTILCFRDRDIHAQRIARKNGYVKLLVVTRPWGHAQEGRPAFDSLRLDHSEQRNVSIEKVASQNSGRLRIDRTVTDLRQWARPNRA